MDATARFAELVGDIENEPPLDLAALLIAAHVPRDVAVAKWTDRLDTLAAACDAADFDGVRRLLFAVEGFRGNVERYDDPANSFLDSVLDRRLGIPITLAVVMLEVARRLDVPAAGIGMPGHFLVGDPARPGRFCDVFAGGALLDAGECEAIFRRAVGPAHAFEPSMLEPVGPRAILARMLANLERSPLAADPLHSTWMTTLHLSIAGLPAAERVVVARRLGQLGNVTLAAAALDELADELPGDAAPRLRGEARALRAQLN
jgi:regulator of sirC expression with transglutaminase-like and TPR domain